MRGSECQIEIIVPFDSAVPAKRDPLVVILSVIIIILIIDS